MATHAVAAGGRAHLADADVSLASDSSQHMQLQMLTLLCKGSSCSSGVQWEFLELLESKLGRPAR